LCRGVCGLGHFGYAQCDRGNFGYAQCDRGNFGYAQCDRGNFGYAQCDRGSLGYGNQDEYLNKLNPAEYLEKLKAEIPFMHIKEYKGGTGFSIRSFMKVLLDVKDDK